MTHLNEELENVKRSLLEMFDMTLGQITKGRKALFDFDKAKAKELLKCEDQINLKEIDIDDMCENILALFCPVAIDLRFILAVLKINANLERIADNLESIAWFVNDSPIPFDNQLMEKIQIMKMFDVSEEMLVLVKEAFESEDTKKARSVFKLDEILDTLHRTSPSIAAELIRKDNSKIDQSLYLISMIGKLERVGDQCKNIGEEINFFVKAKILKHRKSRALLKGGDQGTDFF